MCHFFVGVYNANVLALACCLQVIGVGRKKLGVRVRVLHLPPVLLACVFPASALLLGDGQYR